MANVCSSCSTDNADGALVCRQCGAALASAGGWSRSLIPEDDTFDPLSAPTLVMQHTAPAMLPDVADTQPLAPEGNTGRRLVWGLAGFVLLLGAGVWLLRPSGDEPVTPLAPAPAVAASTAMSAASAALPAPEPALTASTAMAALPTAPAGAAEAAAAAVVAASSTAPAALPASATDRRKRIPEPVLRRPVPASAPALPASEPAPAPPPPLPPAPLPEPPRPRTVAESCAGSSLLTRGFCEHRECAKPELAGDPVCVRLKETEEARRLRQ